MLGPALPASVLLLIPYRVAQLAFYIIASWQLFHLNFLFLKVGDCDPQMGVSEGNKRGDGKYHSLCFSIRGM